MNQSFAKKWPAIFTWKNPPLAGRSRVERLSSWLDNRLAARIRHRHFALSLAFAISLSGSGCVTTPRTIYTAGEASVAQIDGFDDIRAYADAPPSSLGDKTRWLPLTGGKSLDVLCLSGGGSGGAFTVGVLSAWSRQHTRPVFDVVTGVSTGALIAPYAFLGSAYDKPLADLYTGGKAKELVDARWLGTGLLGTSILKGERLRQVISEYITSDILRQVAAEHRRGRRLFVLTTNLDSQRGVVWNMGAIADSGNPDSLALFRNILIASASIPGVFPAVAVKAKSGAKQIEELHSDGGASMQFFGLPDNMLASPGKPSLPDKKQLEIYVIINNALMPEFATTNNSTIAVAGRSYATMVKSQTKQALLALYNHSQRTNIRLRIASIDKQIPYSIFDPFNTDYMRAVFADGYDQTVAGTLWKDNPVF
ncbi:patatin-like phospholipase family protein [Agrobacterium sp. 22-221-1]